MDPLRLADELEIIHRAYVRNGSRVAAERAVVIARAIQHIRENVARVEAIETGTQYLLLQAAEHVGEQLIRTRRHESR